MSSLSYSMATVPNIITLLVLSVAALQVEGRAFFVFGDSLVDNGNNNFLATSARADAPPYGIDYPSHRPTGRFSNGYNVPDLISQRLGSETTLPYLSPELTGQRLLNGANFASAGIGILNDTGVQFAHIIRMYKQFILFREYQARLSALIGVNQTRQLVNGALYLITIGGNDYVNNYYLTPVTPRSIQFNIQDYTRYLISEFRKLLVEMYQLGARRVLVTGMGPLGCTPAEIASKSPNSNQCAVELQRASEMYNRLLLETVKGLNQDLGSDVFIAVNAMRMHGDFIDNPRAYGFITSKIACCGQGRNNGIGFCTLSSNICPNRDLYAFWDPYHPSEKANKIIVEQMFSGNREYMYPMNLSTIMVLDSEKRT